MMRFLIFSAAILITCSASAQILFVKTGNAVDDEGIKRTIMIFDGYDNAIKQPNNCNLESSEVPAALIDRKNNKILPACWIPARTDGVGYFRYVNQYNEKEFTFIESEIKFKSEKYNTKTNKMVN